MNSKKTGILSIILFLITFTIVLENCSRTTSEDAPVETEQEQIVVSIDSLNFKRISRKEIQLSWTDEFDVIVDTYLVKRRNTVEGIGSGEWSVVGMVKSNKCVDDIAQEFVDRLDEDSPQQFEYRIDIELAKESTTDKNLNNTEDFVSEDRTDIIYEAAEGTPILASNVKICIDPGHFHKPGEVMEVDEYAYVEGDFMLEVALELQEQLKWQYGIDSCLTRDSATITLGGYTDEELDSAHISLRGEYAAEEDCDLFVSLHTNSNAENANGFETFSQPLALNKPIIIVNTVALESEIAMKAANAIGTKLASVNYEIGLADSDEFTKVTAAEIGEWTQEYNDGLNQSGTVVIRTGKKNPDYYGVLRGATNVSIPGMIIEHGYHSIPEIRQAAVIGDLKEVWALADACGIAYGFGFTK